MDSVCPNCDRPLPVTDPGEARFCMFCGSQLPDASVLPSPHGETQFHFPDPEGGAEPASAPAVRLPFGAVTIAGYRLIRLLGSGGMGTVYEAESSASGRRVAVKILAGRLAANPASVERFRQEGRVASQISHPRCVFVLGADADAGRPFIVMELMPGRTLKDRVDEAGPLPVAEALARVLDVIDGLAEAHRLGVIHRDVKPSNCFLTSDDRVKVGDFGLSKSLLIASESDPSGAADPTRESPANLTVSGAFLGTVMYASPEQIRGEPVGYDSDVYAVSATLYFLLAGRAPFQHESLTASLARAVSEAAPPIRPRRPDVPRELDRLIRRGLDRDRARRFPTLEALRDALGELRPEAQKPARLGAIVLAYVCDTAILQLVTLPADISIEVASPGLHATGHGLLGTAAMFIYFALFEGLGGATPGKRLLRLRVAELGEIGPPGLKLGAARAALWCGISAVAFTLPGVAGEYLGPGGVLAALAVGLGLLAVELKRTPRGFRGLHDRATGCAVVERARPPHRPLIKSRLPNPLDRAQPAGHAPASVGGFAVAGRLSSLPDGSDVYLADDRALGRRVLLHVRPAGAPEPGVPEVELTRPTRLRVIGRGRVGWPAVTPGRTDLRSYTALVAPAGSPLVDLSRPDKPLTWAEARPILEQLVDELVTSEAEGTQLAAGVAQVWVEPIGRPQLLDFPLPVSRAGARLTPPAAPLDLVRQVATLALEGEARVTGGRVRAAIPLHASHVTDGLFDPQGYDSLAALQRDLDIDSTRPAAVTSSLRRTHLGLFLPLAAGGVIWMLVFGGFLNFLLAGNFDRDSRDLEALRVVLADPAERAALRGRATGPLGADLDGYLAPDKIDATLAELRQTVVAHREREALFRSRLNRPEGVVFDRAFVDVTPPPVTPRRAAEQLRGMRRPRPGGGEGGYGRRVGLLTFGGFVLLPVATWVALAFLWRGGFALSVAGIAHVRADGRRAGRCRVAVRELLVWTPFAGLLLAAVAAQALAPELIALRTGLWLAAVASLAGYALVALRYPARPPQDRILGMVLVPQ